MTNKNKIKILIEIAEDNNVLVERGNMIRWDGSIGSQFRYNIKKNVIRFECRKLSSTLWTRISSHSIKDLNINLWTGNMNLVNKKQNRY